MSAVVVAWQELQAFVERAVLAMGAPSPVAAEVARHLVRANLSGHDSHGVLRLSQYEAEVDAGALRPDAETVLLLDTTATALFDAGRGFGQWSTMVATGWAAERAHQCGVAAAAVRHSTHIGRLGEYTERIAEAGLIGVVTVGQAGPGAGTVAPYGGAARFLSTNPWSICVPAGGRPPMLFDAATSTVAEGKVRLARVKDAEVPLGVIRDAAGRPSRDPVQLYAGGSLTVLGGVLAGHKGYGLSLASALVGGLAMIGDLEPTSAGTGNGPLPGEPRLAGVFVAAIDPAAFGDPKSYALAVARCSTRRSGFRRRPARRRCWCPVIPSVAAGRRESGRASHYRPLCGRTCTGSRAASGSTCPPDSSLHPVPAERW